MSASTKKLIIWIVLLLALGLAVAEPLTAVSCKDCHYLAIFDLFICIRTYYQADCYARRMCIEIDGEERCFDRCTAWISGGNCPI